MWRLELHPPVFFFLSHNFTFITSSILFLLTSQSVSLPPLLFFFLSFLLPVCIRTFFKEFSGQVQALEVIGFDSRPCFLLFLLFFFSSSFSQYCAPYFTQSDTFHLCSFYFNMQTQTCMFIVLYYFSLIHQLVEKKTTREKAYLNSMLE